jgi:hypothetical protein
MWEIKHPGANDECSRADDITVRPKEKHHMEKPTKENLVKEILALAKAKQGKEREKCMELTEDADITIVNGPKTPLILEVANTIAEKYGIKFPTDPRSVGTISKAADYVLNQLGKKKT